MVLLYNTFNLLYAKSFGYNQFYLPFLHFGVIVFTGNTP
jgi:hypothetical protein